VKARKKKKEGEEYAENEEIKEEETERKRVEQNGKYGKDDNKEKEK
jgi:hypothetical protein